MRRAVKPLLVSLLCLVLPALFICIGVLVVNKASGNNSNAGFKVENGHIHYTEDGETWDAIIAVADLMGNGIS